MNRCNSSTEPVFFLTRILQLSRNSQLVEIIIAVIQHYHHEQLLGADIIEASCV